MWTQPHFIPRCAQSSQPSHPSSVFGSIPPPLPALQGQSRSIVVVTPIKLEPDEGIDLHAQGLHSTLISRGFAVNRIAPEKARRRQKLFFPLLSIRVATYSIYLSKLTHVRTDDGTAGLIAWTFCLIPGSGRPPLLPLGGGLALLCIQQHLDF